MPETLLPLIVFTAVATISPGGATTLATASGAQFGFRGSVPLLTGIAIGLASLAASAAAGLAALLLATPALQVAMKSAGSAYLLWLAWRISRNGAPQMQSNSDQRPIGFWAGFLLLWLNPKAWAMTLGAAASFAALSASPLQFALLLGVSFGTGAIVSVSLWCLGGLLLARLLQTDWQWRAVNAVLGLLLAASIIPMWIE